VRPEATLLRVEQRLGSIGKYEDYRTAQRGNKELFIATEQTNKQTTASKRNRSSTPTVLITTCNIKYCHPLLSPSSLSRQRLPGAVA